MRTVKASVLLVAVFLSFAAAAETTQNDGPALLFFQHADKGVLQQDDKTDGCYQLQLSGEDKDVIYLSNSPEEITGHLSIQNFILSWQHQKQITQNFQPNAILHAKIIGSDKKVTQVSDVFVLKSISYANKKMHYSICRFKDEKTPFKTGPLHSVNIFVDPFHRWPP